VRAGVARTKGAVKIGFSDLDRFGMNRLQTEPHRDRPPASAGASRRGMLPAIALVFASLFFVTAAGAGEIVVVLSSDAAPYLKAEAGYTAALADRHETFRTVLLKDFEDQGIDPAGEKPDAILAIGTPAAVYLHERTQPSPVIFCMVSDPAGENLDQGAKIAGVSTDVPIAEQCSLISQAIPDCKVVGMLYRSSTPGGERILQSMQKSLPAKWRLEAVDVDKFSSTADAIAELIHRRADVAWTSVSAGVYDGPTVRALLLAALRTNLPVFGFSPSFVRAGALVGVGVDPAAQGKQAAAMTGQILTSPNVDHNLRIEAPQIYQIAVNQIVADKIGVSLPQDLVKRATYVFKEND
jgi:putative tryptophan/tyrosine transport system substrate-binding protein